MNYTLHHMSETLTKFYLSYQVAKAEAQIELEVGEALVAACQ